MSVKVPSNCIDRLQSLDLSVDLAIKDQWRKSFPDGYACQVQLQIESGKEIEDVRVDTSLSIMKELEAKRIVSAYDYLCCNPSISLNGFKAAGILDATKRGIISVNSDPLGHKHPFAELTDDDSS